MDIFTGFVSLLFCAYYIYTKHWVMNNIIGLAFSAQGVAMLALGSWRNGAVLLVRCTEAQTHANRIYMHTQARI